MAALRGRAGPATTRSSSNCRASPWQQPAGRPQRRIGGTRRGVSALVAWPSPSSLKISDPSTLPGGGAGAPGRDERAVLKRQRQGAQALVSSGPQHARCCRPGFFHSGGSHESRTLGTLLGNRGGRSTSSRQFSSRWTTLGVRSPPLWFETMAFQLRSSTGHRLRALDCERYSTQDAGSGKVTKSWSKSGSKVATVVEIKAQHLADLETISEVKRSGRVVRLRSPGDGPPA